MNNKFGQLFSFMSFGESHGEALGVVIDGMPSNIEFDKALLLDFLRRRRPGGKFVSSRKEEDLPELLSGVFENKTLGTPISCVFRNHDARSKDYKNLEPRRGHADAVWKEKYGHTDPRGGGRSSGRETVSRVVAGAFAKMAMQETFPNLEVRAKAKSIFGIEEETMSDHDFFNFNMSPLGFASEVVSSKAEDLLVKGKEDGNSFGGVVEVRIANPMKSLGQPVFGKIKAKLAEAVMSLGAVKSFSLGEDVDLSKVSGQEFHKMNESVYGGVLGGLATGETIKFYVEVKPTSSILDVSKKGRHDPCIVPRILVVLESMVWAVFMDLWLMRKAEMRVYE